MAKITVSYVDGNIEMSDKGHTKAKKNEVVHWHPGTGVYSVSEIKVKASSPKPTANIWTEVPQENGVNFKGKISQTAIGDWDYDISCNVGTNKDPIIISIDPRIQVES